MFLALSHFQSILCRVIKTIFFRNQTNNNANHVVEWSDIKLRTSSYDRSLLIKADKVIGNGKVV